MNLTQPDIDRYLKRNDEVAEFRIMLAKKYINLFYSLPSHFEMVFDDKELTEENYVVNPEKN